MTGEEDFFLVAEVVIKVPLLHVQRGRDLFDGRAVVAEPPERGGRAFRISTRVALGVPPLRAAASAFGRRLPSRASRFGG